jgi:hypothetical protein
MKAQEARELAAKHPSKRLASLIDGALSRIRYEASEGKYNTEINVSQYDAEPIKLKLVELGYTVSYEIGTSYPFYKLYVSW